jgi:hypothetical protein
MSLDTRNPRRLPAHRRRELELSRADLETAFLGARRYCSVQSAFAIPNESGALFRVDNNTAHQANATLQAGASAPATTFAYQWWADTTTGLLKRRNAANSAWITVGLLDGTMIQSPSDPFLINNKVLRLGINAGNVGAFLQLQGWSSANKNWEVSADGVTGGLHIRPSTGAGGTTFTSDALALGEDGRLTWGSGVGNFGTITKRKTADQSVTSSITLQDDAHLTFAIAANEEWAGVCEIHAGDGMGGTGLKTAITVPSGATLIATTPTLPGAGTVTVTTSGGAMALPTTDAKNLVRVAFWVLNGATPGNVTLQWAQSASSGTPLTFKKGSLMTAVRVA